MNRFTYFDFIAYIVPGALLLGAVSLVVGSNTFILITGNVAVDTILFAIISFTVGAFFHQLSNHTVEPVVKRLFWHKRFYSEIYLVKRYGLCRDPLRNQITDTAEFLFKFDRASLSLLDSDLSSEVSSLHP